MKRIGKVVLVILIPLVSLFISGVVIGVLSLDPIFPWLSGFSLNAYLSFPLITILVALILRKSSYKKSIVAVVTSYVIYMLLLTSLGVEDVYSDELWFAQMANRKPNSFWLVFTQEGYKAFFWVTQDLIIPFTINLAGSIFGLYFLNRGLISKHLLNK